MAGRNRKFPPEDLTEGINPLAGTAVDLAERPASAELIRSEEAAEMMERPPAGLVRWGLLTVVGAIALLGVIASVIRYPDTLEGPMTLTTDPLPVMLKANGGGRIFRLYAAEGEAVSAGQAVIELESTMRYTEVVKLSSLADNTLLWLGRKDLAKLAGLSTAENGALGEAQPLYNNLLDAVAAYALRYREDIYAKRSGSLRQQAGRYRSLSAIGGAEQALIAEELRQADERFAANEKLYADRVISKQEYSEEATRLRERKLALEGGKKSAVQAGISIAEEDKQALEMAYDRAEKESAQAGAIRVAARNLQAFVQAWRLQYLISAPYTGRVRFLRPVQPAQAVAASEELCAIVPLRHHFAASVKLPAQGSGKLRSGQIAHLHTDQFPYTEYGYLEGKVSGIAAIPETDKEGATWRVTISLPDSLVTTHRRALPFTAQMSGVARIITEDRSLLGRVLSGVTGLKK